ncbi:tol-pal system protein YbgF [Psychromonas algicola]|uniref:tol-pal system protein YbgF n=1 Tax=Psychromonas algicola TaxID=2555642 RepID=UPI001067F3AD|nr:tol-pal system protein YbgF [Psychromonas sp. RZ5]TEW45987.1 tol-pal system protein YbgF [Psychromonas sp. RZ5]
MRIRNTAAIVLAAFFSLPAHAEAPVTDATNYAASNTELLQRIDELTRVMTIRNKMQVRFQSQLDGLGQELNEMRGSLEVFSNQLEQIEDRQRNLYQMLDERTVTSAPASTAAVNAPTENSNAGSDDKAAYEAALALVLNEKRYAQAITAFEAFVIDHPESESVPNAQYWLGQLLYREKKRNEARAAFLVVIDKYPDSNKRADSLFKIGIIDEYSGSLDSAKSFYQKTISEYPSSSAAGLAAKRLKGL